MQLTKEKRGECSILMVHGRLDGTTSPKFETEVLAWLATGGKSFVLDMAGISFMSSAALRVLLSMAKRVGRTGGKVVLSSPNSVVSEVFEISNFSAMFTICPTLDEGVSAATSGVAQSAPAAAAEPAAKAAPAPSPIPVPPVPAPKAAPVAPPPAAAPASPAPAPAAATPPPAAAAPAPPPVVVPPVPPIPPIPPAPPAAPAPEPVAPPVAVAPPPVFAEPAPVVSSAQPVIPAPAPTAAEAPVAPPTPPPIATAPASIPQIPQAEEKPAPVEPPPQKPAAAPVTPPPVQSSPAAITPPAAPPVPAPAEPKTSPAPPPVAPPVAAPKKAGPMKLEVIVGTHIIECRDGDVIGLEGTVAPHLFKSAVSMQPRHVLIGRGPDAWFLMIPRNVQVVTHLDNAVLTPGVRQSLTGEHHLKVGDFAVSLRLSEGQPASSINDSFFTRLMKILHLG